MRFFLILFLLINTTFAREAISEKSKQQVIAILDAQESLHAAFFEYKPDQVEARAKNVADTIKKLSDKRLASDFKSALIGINEVTATNDEEKNKEAYFKFSSVLSSIVKRYDLGDKYNVYYCPMIKKSWVQDSSKHDDVRNPYASYMPNCGRKETKY